jgi:single-strand DNA-binding protein
MNRVTLLGNVGRDPEIRRTQGGETVANVSLATNERWKDKSTGEKRERVEWHRLVFFGKVAEVVEKYVRKGSRVLVEGKMQTRKWEDQSGAEKYTTEVVISGFQGSLELLGEAGGGGGGRSGDSGASGGSRDDDDGYGGAGGYGGGSSSSGGGGEDLDDTIPF